MAAIAHGNGYQITRLPDGSRLVTYKGDVADGDVFNLNHDNSYERGYLSVDEQSTYIDVTCDGYVCRVGTSMWDITLFSVRNYANDTAMVDINPYWSDGTAYYLGYDSARTTEIIENTPNRVKIRVIGSLSSTNNTTDTYITNLPSGSVKYEFTIYPDRYTVRTEWKPIGAISHTNSYILTHNGSETNLTGEDHFYENNGAESSASTYTTYNSADYLCFTSNEMNAQSTLLDQSGWSFDQRTSGVCDFEYRDQSALAAGTYTATVIIIIDSAQRANGSKKFTSVERLEMGDQYNDTSMPTAVGYVTDNRIPANIGDYGFCSDGAWHLDASTKNRGRVEPDIIRHDPVLVYENWQVRTGDLTNADDHLIGHWKCDDDAASTTIVDSSGKIGNMVIQGGYDSEDLSSTDAVRGSSLVFDSTQDFAYVTLPTSGIYDPTNWKDDFTIIIKFKPNFSYDVASAKYLLSLYRQFDERISISYQSGVDMFYANVYLNSSDEGSIITNAFTSDNDLKQWHTAIFAVSVTNNIAYFALDGEAIGTLEFTENWSADPTAFVLNSQRSTSNAPGDYYIDEVKLFDGCLLPYGGGPMTGNDSVNTDVAHEDISFYWDTENDTPAIGGSVFTSKDGSYVAGGPTGSYYDNESSANSARFALTSEHIDPNEGMISFWFYLPSLVTGDFLFGIFGGMVGPNSIHLRINYDSELEFRYTTASYTSNYVYSGVISAGIWHHAICRWSQSNNIVELVLNGISQGVDTIQDPWGGSTSGTLYIGQEGDESSGIDAWIAGFYISDNPHTPDRWSVFGKPVYMPLVKKNGIYQKYGQDMEAVTAPDGSVIITDLGEVS